MHLGLVLGWEVKNWASARSKTEALGASGSPGSPGWLPPLTLLISSRSSACIQMGLWLSGGDTWDGMARLENRALQYGESQDPEAHRAGLKGSGSPWESLWPNPQPLVCISFPPSSSLSRPSPLTIHRPKLLHMGSGQDLFVERLRLSIFTLFQVTGSLGAGRQKHRSKRWSKLSARLRDFHLVFSL